MALVYRIKDSETATWLADNTGKIEVDDETRTVETNIALAEVVDNKRTLRQGEANLIDSNLFLGMTKGCGVLFGAHTEPKFCFTSPVQTNRTQEALEPSHIDTTAPILQSGKGLAHAMTALDDLPTLKAAQANALVELDDLPGPEHDFSEFDLPDLDDHELMEIEEIPM